MMSFQTIKKQTQDLLTFGLFARLLNFLKGILLAYFIGANFRTDTYLVAFSASVFLIGIVADALIVSLIPIYHQIDRRDGKKGRFEFTHNLISYWTILGFILMVLNFILAPYIVRLFGPGFGPEGYNQAVRLFRYGAPIVMAHVYRAIFGGYLQSQHLFRAGAKGGVANALIYIAYLVFLSRFFGLEGLMVTGIIAVGAQAYMLAKPVFKKQGYRYKPVLVTKDRSLIRLNRFLFPIVIGLGIHQLNQAIDNAVGSFLAEGTIAELSYAKDIIDLFVGVVVMSLVTAIFPVVSEKDHRIDKDELDHSLRYSLRLITMVVVPATVMLLVMAEPIVRIFYQRGEFTAQAAQATSMMLVYYSIGIIGTSLMLLVTRLYYANENTTDPIVLAAFALILNIIFDVVFVLWIGPGGIALGSSLSVLIASVYGVYDLDSTMDFLHWKDITLRSFKVVLAGVMMASVLVITMSGVADHLGETLLSSIVMVLLGAVLGLGTFFATIFITRA
jgi:putative peptidoglycan lipid II flippase